jgi:hypothetical protein
MCLINGDQVLIGRQNDAHIQLWNIAGQTGEVIHGAAEHFLGAFDMKTQIALAAIAKLLLEVCPTVLAVGMWPEVKHTRARNIAETRDHFIECLAAVCFSGKQVYTASRTEDVFSAERSSLGTDAIDLPVNDGVNATIVARQNGVRCLIFLGKVHFPHSSFWLKEQKIALVTEASLGESPRCT